MEIYIFLFCIVCFLASAVFAFMRQAHMFQLNSYGAGTHIKWMFKNPQSMTGNLFALLFGACAFYGDAYAKITGLASYVLHIIFALAFLALIMLEKPKKKAKTPLVYTARVKRLMVTYLVFAVIVAFLAYFLPVKGIWGCCFLGLLCPFFIGSRGQ